MTEDSVAELARHHWLCWWLVAKVLGFVRNMERLAGGGQEDAMRAGDKG